MKVLIVSSVNSTFVQSDIDELALDHDVRFFNYGSPKGINHLLRQFALIYWLILNLRGANIIFSWFADFHSLAPALGGRLFKIKFIVQIGGFDAANLPEYNYGSFNSVFRSWIVNYTCLNANKILCSSKNLANHLRNNLKFSLDNKIAIAYPSNYNLLKETNYDVTNRNRSNFLCVSSGKSRNRLLIKGIDRYVEMARLNSSINFQLIGVSKSDMLEIFGSLPPNLEAVGFVPNDKLHDYYLNAIAIVQLSRFEAFGLAVLEGASLGCYPIVADNTGLTEIVEMVGGSILKIFNNVEYMEAIKLTQEANPYNRIKLSKSAINTILLSRIKYILDH